MSLLLGADETHRDFRVRRAKVLTALQWLIQNNRYYADVTIDNHILAELPIDGHLTNLPSVLLSTNDAEVSEQEEDDTANANLPSTFVPASVQTFTEQGTIQQSIINP